MLSLLTVVSGLEQALHFRSSPMDGPLQLYNALRRIAAGQQPGVDFQFFHGIGVPYLHYLPFRLFGGGFGAAEITRQFLTAVAYPLLLLAFFRAFTNDWRKTVALSAIVMALSLALRLSTILVAINSLLGIRSLVATTVPIVWYALRASRWRAPATGVLLGLSLLTGTEQGLAAFAAFVVVGSLLALRGERRRAALAHVATVLGAGIATAVALLMIVGGWAGLRGALRYNLSLLPKDQYWYFGAPPNAFISDWSSAISLMAGAPIIPLTLLAAAGLLALNLRRLWRETDELLRLRHAALAMMCLYGIMSSASLLGIFLFGYVQPCIRVVLLVGTLEVASRLTWDRAGSRFSVRRPLAVGVAAIVLMLLSVRVLVWQSLATVPHFVGEHLVRGKGVAFEGMWPRALVIGDSIVARAQLTPSTPVWSTYAGLLEARHGMFNPDFDYIIHALGPENRADYVNTFVAARPKVVQTVLPQFSPYEQWLEQTSWDFYREVITNYRPAAATPWSIFWERLPAPASPPFLVWASRVPQGVDSVVIPLPPSSATQPGPVLLQVEVKYRAVNPLSWVPVFGALPRYLVHLDGSISRGPVTLNPFVGTTRFPLITREGSRPTLRFATKSLLPGARLVVSDVRVSAVPIAPTMVPWLVNVIAAETAAARRP